MSRPRKIALIGIAAAVALVGASWHARAAEISLPETAILVLAIAAAAAVALSFFCMPRYLTLSASLCTAGSGGLELNQVPAAAGSQFFWCLALIALAMGIFGAAMAYLGEDAQIEYPPDLALAGSTAPLF